MELISPGLGLVFWMALSFLILLFILKKFAWKPVLNMLHERERKIDEAISEAEKVRAEMEKIKLNNEQLIQQAKIERDKMIQEAKELKEKIIEEAKIKAQEEANRIIQSARETINYEKMAAITELKNQVGLLSIEIAEKILKEELSDIDKHKKLINNLLDEISFN